METLWPKVRVTTHFETQYRTATRKQGTSPKLSARGAAKLEYDVGINDKTDEASVRISGNENSSTYSITVPTGLRKGIRNVQITPLKRLSMLSFSKSCKWDDPPTTTGI